MRRWQMCIAVTLASVLSAPVAQAAVSPDGGAGALVSGLLLGAGGRQVPGSVEVFAWPTGRPVAVGQTLNLTPVGFDRADDGRFSIHSDLTSELADLAELNGGYVNFVLQATTGGVIEETHFSRYVGVTRFTGQEATGRSGRKVEWRSSPEEDDEPVQVTFAERTADQRSGQVAPMQGGCWSNKLVETTVAETVIGELRTPDDTIEAYFTYGERADSEIGVATSGAHGPWSAAGSFHIANAEDTSVTQWAESGQHLLVTGRFIYDRYEYICGTGKRQRIVAREWMGDVQGHPTGVRGCGGAPETKLGRYRSNSGFNRDREKAVKWEGAAGVFGASLTARSGYSRWVHGHWRFGGASMHLLCGDDGPPKEAGHIYAGPSA